MPAYDGHLELTRTNKRLRLLNEVAAEVGKVRVADNLPIWRDALSALTSLARLREFASECLGKVNLAYPDPPLSRQWPRCAGSALGRWTHSGWTAGASADTEETVRRYDRVGPVLTLENERLCAPMSAAPSSNMRHLHARGQDQQGVE